MVKILSLSKARKAVAREKKRQKADENATKFGRSKVEKTRDQSVKSRLDYKLDQHRRDDS